MPSTSPLTLGDLADALDVARRTLPRLGWLVVPDEQLPNGRYQIDPDRQMFYLARSLTPAETFTAWIDAMREITGVADRTAEVIPLHYPQCPEQDTDRTG